MIEVTPVDRGKCAECGENIAKGPYMGVKVTLGEISFILDNRCRFTVADAIRSGDTSKAGPA